MKQEIKNPLSILFLLMLFGLFSACNKQNDFLNTKPNEALAAITNLQQCQSLLQNENVFSLGGDPSLGWMESDDYYLTSSDWTGLDDLIQENCYIWAKDIYPAGDEDVNDWFNPYIQVYNANIVLEALPKIAFSANQQSLYNQVKGEALFYRAYAFYNLVQTFAMPYDSATAGSEPGIPLRLSSDFNAKAVRASENDCYSRIIQDLQASLPLLPAHAISPTLPSLAAANAMLARTYLAMGNFGQSFQFADAYLSQNPQLTDYNTVNDTLNNSGRSIIGSGFLNEDLYHATSFPYDIVIGNYLSKIDTALYQTYAPNDLRKSLFFTVQGGVIYFIGSYDYQGYAFCGIATDEIYLIRAECSARMGNTAAAMNDLNALLINRWATGTFVPFTAADANDALRQILTERRKELLYRGLRWTDLRRLNKEARFAITLTRVINGVTYTLPPNDPRYALPIPDDEIQLSGIPQNPR